MMTTEYRSSLEMTEDSLQTNQPVWIFGYGSLIWKTNFTYDYKVTGYIRGYARRFWQGSTDHRGAPGSPGRVVTLVESQEETTWGVAFRVNSEDFPEVMDYLNQREIDGYKMSEVLFHPVSEQNSTYGVKTFLYIATENNLSYLGPASMEDIAKQVVHSHGHSGCNSEYVLELANGMREIAPNVNDRHLFDLEFRVKELLRDRNEHERRRNLTCKCKHCGPAHYSNGHIHHA